MVRIGAVNFRGNQSLNTSLRTDLNGYGFGSPKYVRFLSDHRWKPQLGRFGEKNINKVLIKYKIICRVVIIIILKIAKIYGIEWGNWELAETITVYSNIIISYFIKHHIQLN